MRFGGHYFLVSSMKEIKLRIHLFWILLSCCFCSQHNLALNPLSINPNCKDSDEAIQCEDDCLSGLTTCYNNCKDQHDCINDCMRQHSVCYDSCPCHSDCYDGCPCPTTSVYCLECEEKFENEFNDCHQDQISLLGSCLGDCDGHDDDCETKCFIKYKISSKNCPCMENCENGCPCPYYDCSSSDNGDGNGNGGENIDEHLQGKLQIQPLELDGECYQNFFNTTPSKVEFSKVSQNQIAKTSSSLGCINSCKDAYHQTYKYAVLERGGYCYCAGAEPYKELHGQCGIPCSGSHTDYCGGPGDTATFYTLNNTDQRCSYDLEESIDHDFNTTTIVGNDNDDVRKSCWAKFSCPNKYHVQYYFHYFDTWGNMYNPTAVYLYNDPLDKNDVIEYYGSSGEPNYPVLYQWIDFPYSDLRFEYRSYYTYNKRRGFKMRLRCASANED